MAFTLLDRSQEVEYILHRFTSPCIIFHLKEIMNNTPDTKLLKEVNPVFATAQVCLLVMAEAGNADAKMLVSKLGFDRGIESVESDMLTETEKFRKMKAIPGFTTMIEARFTASSNLIRGSRIKNIVDLPCGYTPRGLEFAQSGRIYHGFDLPAVIEVMGSACRCIDIDMKDLDYISSAGLRVLLLMMKERPENGNVTLYHVKPAVRSVLTSSGFDQMLCIRPQAD